VVEPVSSEPQSTTANFGDWTLRCTRLGATANAAKVCEVIQSIGVQGQANPIAQLAFGYEEPKANLKFTAVLPVNISFNGPITLSSGDANPAVLQMNWTRCLPEGCFANTDVDEATIALLRAQTEKGKVAFKDGATRDAILPVSFRGLAEALDALNKAN
jgi:invasion protein IalB